MARKKLSLEEYSAFLRNPQDESVLTIGQLNHVIVMHGFIKLHNRPKKEVADAVRSIGALLPPTRSTLHENISACARLAIDEVEKGLAELGWQECPVRSIKTLKSTAPDDDAVGAGDDVRRICGSSTLDPGSFPPPIVGLAAKGKRSKSKKRKQRDLQAAMGANPPAAATIDVLADVAAAAAAACPFDGSVAPNPSS